MRAGHRFCVPKDAKGRGTTWWSGTEASLRFFGQATRQSLFVGLGILLFSGYVIGGENDNSTVASIRLRSGAAVEVSEVSTEAFRVALQSGFIERLHGVVTLDAVPNDADRAQLAGFGLQLLAPLSGNLFRVRVDRNADFDGLHRHRLAPRIAYLHPSQKLETSLQRHDDEREHLVMVWFQREVPLSEQRRVIKTLGAPMLLIDGAWVGAGRYPIIEALVREDVVSWVESPRMWKWAADWVHPALLDPVLDGYLHRMGILKPGTNDDSPNESLIDFDGEGVVVGLFDFGIDARHPDLSPINLIHCAQGECDGHWHATHLAGLIAGTGRSTRGYDSCGRSNLEAFSDEGQRSRVPANAWRGVAPRATLLDIRKGRKYALDAIRGDIHLDAIRRGMQLSNHSYPVSVAGTYDVNNAIRDALIRGDATYEGDRIASRLQVMSAGNKEASHFSVTKGVKNGLVVANWSLADERVSPDSNSGPTADGRIKPDVAAPGSYLWSTWVHLSSSDLDPLNCKDEAGVRTSRHGTYAFGSGSSQAAAVTTGVAALLIEAAGRTRGANDDPRAFEPAWLRAVLVHTACNEADLNSACANWQSRRPNFRSGWGLIRVGKALESVQAGHVYRGKVVAKGEEQIFEFDVPNDRPAPIRITLAWDDPAADPALEQSERKLVNDLDVVVSSGGLKFFPWKAAINRGSDSISLGEDCGELCAPGENRYRAKDRINNIEVIDMPGRKGRWQVKISAHSLPEGNQNFVIISDLPLVRTVGSAEIADAAHR